MAFGADELRVLRRALAVALHPVPLADDDVRDCLRLADSVDEAVRETGRLRAFLFAELARYRDALPGTAIGYLERLQDALAAGYDPRPDDLAALRTLRGNPAATAVLRRCQALAEQSVRSRLTERAIPVPAPAQEPSPRRARLLALPGGRAADAPKPGPGPQPKPEPQPQPKPDERPVPKPSEVFPPRRKPVPPPEQWAVG
ncbi:hypothetical protein [Streptomyces xantholiticus]|uniref:hypothetical protein n=1 Tax=Streptomyces xantholiticus TaxID=68285 RepID=UPI00167B0D9E|nr:hypothetical protein [Streptomyces xantholiticus]GGW61030.1 hypothetical protein GCM10010381_52720 [Streptomyces xantholiticus]